MNPYYIVKQALSQQAQEQRYVNPMAQIWARQMGVNPAYLVNRDMGAAMAQLTARAQGKPSNAAYIPDVYVGPQYVNTGNVSSAPKGKMLNNKELEALFATSSGYNMGTGTDGAWNAVARLRTLPAEDENIERILNSPCLYGQGSSGTVDVNALLHKIVKPVKWKGPGKFVLSDNKFQDISNPDNIGKFGRNGGQSLA